MDTTPTSKKVLVPIVIAVLAVIGIVFYLHRGTTGLPATVSETTPVPTTGNWPSTKLSEQTLTDDKSYYTISATYPVVQDATINGYFKSFIDDAVSEFKDDTSWAADGGADAPAEAASLSLKITYTEEKNANADNYVFTTDTYTGGAHDLESTKTFSFSPTGQQITLTTLFTNGTAGLKTIAPYVKAQLATNPDANQSMIDDGTAPTADNYQSFTVEDNSVTFTFDPYQVAPYSDGIQTVKVPVSVFKSIASPNLFK